MMLKENNVVEVALEEEKNSSLKAVNVDVEYQKKVRDNPIIVTNSRNPEIIWFQEFGMFR